MPALPQTESASADPARLTGTGMDAGLAANDAGATISRVASARNRFIGDKRTALLAKRQSIVLQVLADFSSESSLDGGLMAAANSIKSHLQCTRVSFGLCRNSRTRVAAISQQADVNAGTAETQLLAAAMQETSERDDMIDLSGFSSGEGALQAHRLLGAGRPERQIVSIPVCHEGHCLGVICLERDSTINMSSLTLQLIRNLADILAPLIATRLGSERSLPRHALESFLTASGVTFSARHMKFKIIIVLLLCLVSAASVVQMTDKIKATAELVPLERRIISAPRDGYIESVETGAGDSVAQGDVLLRLDAGELRVEQSRWQSELSGISSELRSAMAARDRRQMAMLGAESAKGEAQLQLVETQLRRSTVKAPVSGIIVSGDLSQMIGAPVQRGQTLMELAPPEGYEAYLMVDEKDIHRISVADTGFLSLKSLPGERIGFSVSAIHPIGVAESGSNRFRVQADLQGTDAALLPGQTGIGKIEVGSASILWILTHEFSDWFRQKRWEWFG